jgi:methyl-accepting chemotaxis protein
MARGNIHWYSAIRTKIVTAVILVCTFVLGGLAAYNTLNEQKKLTGDLEKLSQITSKRLSQHLIGPMWDLDNELADFTLEAEMLDDNIQAIVVWDAETNAVFSARERGLSGRSQVSSGAIAGDLIKSTIDVARGGKPIGQVAVFVSKKQLGRQLIESIKSGFVAVIAFTLVLIIVMRTVLNRVIIAPVSRLTKHAENISHGNLKQEIVIDSNDEIGQLADALHRMQASLRMAFRRVQAKTKKT